MAKCPRGTPSQVKANFQHFNQPTTFSFGSGFFSWTYDPVTGQMVYVGEKESQTLGPESEGSEFDSARADKRSPPTARDELVYFFISYFLDVLVESWESKPCKKPKLGAQVSASKEGENFGEDLGPCDDSAASSSVDLLKELSQKRLSILSKENIKKGSESSESEYPNEVELELPECVDPLHAFIPDEEVHAVFLNGVWYKGRVSRKLMDGEGTYFWEDGSSYQGEFAGGCVTGRGRLEFSNMTVYEGEVHKAFRHGEGMCFFFDSPVMYSGQWWLGKKHGHGLIVYNSSRESDNYYKGQWQDGFKEGFGFRLYSSGAKYVGFWSNGKRHGQGVMLWNNHDIYRGQWKEGVMHGYGEYTWNGFANKTISYPATNTYRGYWSEGKRNGFGILECKNGGLIETFWIENKKNGPGTVVCCNGVVVTSENLFEKDKQAPFIDQEDNLGLLVGDSARPRRIVGKRPEDEEHTMAYLGSIERAKAISIPILSPPCTLNLDIHTRKYCFQKKLALKIIKLSGSGSNLDLLRVDSSSDTPASLYSKNMEQSRMEYPDQCQFIECMSQEDRHLRNFIIAKISALKACYDYYATLAYDKQPTFQCVLLRMFLWQMLIDADIPNLELSLVDIDDLTAQEESLLVVNPHDPFERVYFWQFLHTLIMLSWHLYGQYVLDGKPLVENEKVNCFLDYFEQDESKMILKTSFDFLLKNDIFQGRFGPDHDPFSSKESGLEESDFAPMKAMYMIYCSLGVPHSARDFLNAICIKVDDDNASPGIVRYFERLPYYKINGQNALTVAGSLHHIPGSKPFNHPELFPLEGLRCASDPKSELTCFNDLKAKGVLKCLVQVCPSIVNDECVANMDYKMTFLEFYKVIILCTERELKLRAMKEIRSELIRDYKTQLEEYEKRVAEREKKNDAVTVTVKKSRQQVEPSKKGRKNTTND